MNGDLRAPGARFWVGVAAGAALMAWGAFLFAQDTPQGDRRINFAVWVVGSDLVHDALVAPLVCLVGVIVARAAPSWARAPVQAGLIATGTVLLVVWLPWTGSADGARNPTIQPLDYTTAALSVLAAVWLVAGVWAVSRRLR